MKKLFLKLESSSLKMICFLALFFIFFSNKTLFSLEENNNGAELIDENNSVQANDFESVNNSEKESNKKFEEWVGDSFFDEMPGKTKYDETGKLLSITFFKDLKDIYTDYYLYTKNGEVRGVKRVYSDGTKSEFFSSLKDGGSFREFIPESKKTETKDADKVITKNTSEFRFYDSLSRELSRDVVFDGKVVDFQKRTYSGESQLPTEFVEEKNGEKTVVKYSSSGEIEKIVKYSSENSSDQTIYSYNGKGELISKLEVVYDNNDLKQKKETRYKYSKSEISQVSIYINGEKQLERIYSVPGDEYADYTEKLYKNGNEVLEVLFSDGKKKTETVIDSGKKVRTRTFL